MKKTLALIFIIASCAVGFLSLRGTMPFLPVFGTSMEPELHAGDMILIEYIDPTEVKVGDIIIYTIPQAVREHYNYPAVIAHRVKTVITEPALVFRTKGDNTGEDPFSVRPQDLRGKVGNQIPYLGFPLLFFQSRQGLIFLITALGLLTFYLYSGELSQGRVRLHKGIFAPIIEENRRSARLITQRLETTERDIGGTQRALESFSSAIAEYAEHLKSHTSAIQGLAEASQELKNGAIEQTKILGRIAEAIDQPRTRMEEPRPRMEEPRPRMEEPRPWAREVDKVVPKPETVGEVIHKLDYKLERKLDKLARVEEVEHVRKVEGLEEIGGVTHEVVPDIKNATFPPGCFRVSRKGTREEKEVKRDSPHRTWYIPPALK
ncbi:signal peptidase I [Chloroflexota bacterium]